MFLVKKINPNIDKICIKLKDKISNKILKTMIVIIMLFLAFDCLATVYAQDIFISRVVVENNIEMDNIERYQTLYDKTCKNELINKLWNNEKMVKTFPNMKIKDKNDNIIYLRDLLPDIQPYYWKK